MVYIPSATISKLGAGESVTLGGMWANSNPTTFGWYIRVSQNGSLSVLGYANGSQAEFPVYGTFPQNQWVDVELGLHSQGGQGVKRAFAFLLNGSFYGWYRQGNMANETYDRAALGILSTNSPDSLNVYVDQWRQMTTAALPDGADNRSIAVVQEQNYRTQNGIQVQYDWSTWQNEPNLHPTHGLYGGVGRLQAGRNIDRMPSVTNGWGEIEIDWPNGTPPNCTGYCSAMVGFRKEVNREENLEIIPWADAGGTFYLVFEAWVPNGPIILAQWRLPNAAATPSKNMPEPGDIIRARWEGVSSTQLRVMASYYDASSNAWFPNVIDHTFAATDMNGVNFFDGYHTASSITIDSIYYSIRRYKVGTLATYPGVVVPPPSNPPVRNYYTTLPIAISWNRLSWAVSYDVEVDNNANFDSPEFTAYHLGPSTFSASVTGLSTDGLYYWRVRGKAANGVPGAWGTDSFTLNLPPPPHLSR
jgi:hypothetical protein